MIFLGRAAAHGRWLLIAGLAGGIFLPWLAEHVAVAIVPLVGVMICVATLREGPRAAFPRTNQLPRTLAATLVLQCVLPLAAGMALLAAGVLSAPLAIAAVLALAGAPITGTPGLAVMSGADAGAALRQLTLGMALLPLTVAPVFAMLPVFPDPLAVGAGALRLLAVIALAVGVAVLLRAAFPELKRDVARPALDGVMAITMSVLVIGLMSAVGPALWNDPGRLLLVLALAAAIHFGQTAGAWRAARATVPHGEALAFAITAGNRNLALFLAAVPAETTAPLMLFVGCYQIPMYLTPLLLPWLTATARPRGGAERG